MPTRAIIMPPFREELGGGESTAFIVFMLKIVRLAVAE